MKITLDFIRENGESVLSIGEGFATLYKMDDGTEYVACYEGIIYEAKAWPLFEQLWDTEDESKAQDILNDLSQLQIA